MSSMRLCPFKGCHRTISRNILYRHLEKAHGVAPDEARRLSANAKEAPIPHRKVKEALDTLRDALRQRGKI